MDGSKDRQTDLSFDLSMGTAFAHLECSAVGKSEMSPSCPPLSPAPPGLVSIICAPGETDLSRKNSAGNSCHPVLTYVKSTHSGKSFVGKTGTMYCSLEGC